MKGIVRCGAQPRSLSCHFGAIAATGMLYMIGLCCLSIPFVVGDNAFMFVIVARQSWGHQSLKSARKGGIQGMSVVSTVCDAVCEEISEICPCVVIL